LLIQIDFSKIDRAVAEYLRGEIKKKAINRDGLIALLNAFQGIEFPRELTAITDKAAVNYEEVKSRIYEKDKNLWVAMARLDVWFSIKKHIGHEIASEETIKCKAATILAHCL
jgi:hypothetical protein